METDLHNCSIIQLSRPAGHIGKDTQTISYASRLVDNATQGKSIRLFKDQLTMLAAAAAVVVLFSQQQ